MQGVGGAMTSAVILGIIVTMFPQPAERAKALGVYAFVAAGGGSIGLLAGGILTETINWDWVFYVNLQRDRGRPPVLPVALLIGTLYVRISAQLIVRFGAPATLLPGLGLIVIGSDTS